MHGVLYGHESHGQFGLSVYLFDADKVFERKGNGAFQKMKTGKTYHCCENEVGVFVPGFEFSFPFLSHLCVFDLARAGLSPSSQR